MKWLKYRHKFSSGLGGWQWKPLYSDDATEASVRDNDVLRDITEEYSYSERYSGIDFEVVDKVPSWVIHAQLRELGAQATATDRALKACLYVLGNGGVEECWQCKDAVYPADAHYKQHGTGTVIKPCPTCGRDVIYDTIPFLLTPNDTDAVKLLGALVEQGERSVKSKKFRWPVEDKDEEAAYHRLGKLGLVGGSSYQNTYKIYATESGKAEWLKHKAKAV